MQSIKERTFDENKRIVTDVGDAYFAAGARTAGAGHQFATREAIFVDRGTDDAVAAVLDAVELANGRRRRSGQADERRNVHQTAQETPLHIATGLMTHWSIY